MVRKLKPGPSKKLKSRRKPRGPHEGHGLPQGCSPAEKLAAFEALAERQGIKPIEDPDSVVADFWPADESIDEFMAAIRALRQRGR